MRDGEGSSPPPPPNTLGRHIDATPLHLRVPSVSDGGELGSTGEDGSNCDWIGDCPKQSKTTNADYNAFELKAA